MNTPALIVDTLRCRGVTLAAIDGRIKVTPAGVLTESDRATIRARRADLLAFLSRPCAAPSSPTRKAKQHSAVPSQNAATPTTDAFNAVEIHQDLATLYPVIREGCLAGLASALDRVPSEIVCAILSAAGSDVDADTTRDTCRRAGQAATFAATIAAYRERLRLLVDLGEDVYHYAAALELCLIHPAAPGVALAPWEPGNLETCVWCRTQTQDGICCEACRARQAD